MDLDRAVTNKVLASEDLDQTIMLDQVSSFTFPFIVDMVGGV